jgi:hypothetical protein
VVEKRYSEQDEAFHRAMMFAEEDRHRFTSKPWDGSYRYFRSENVLCMEHFKRPVGPPLERKPAA